MITINRKEDCYGCTACEATCPTDAIKMRGDHEGFMYPVVDSDKCINCDKCVRVCPKITGNQMIGSKGILYGALNLSEKEYLSSSSGGVFIEICRFVIDNGGVVAGAVYDEEFNVKHELAYTLEACRAFHGSKYTQSNVSGIYPKIKSAIKDNRLVLFSGTPCHIAGLKNYLGKDFENLITCDLICHGVPSPRLFSEYIHFLKQTGEIRSLNFKSKVSDSCKTNIRVEYVNGKNMRGPLKTNIWNSIYFGHYATRQACTECPFASEQRIGDITIGDFWGVHQKIATFPKDKAISLVLVNTPKGKRVMENIKSKFFLVPSTFEDASQPSLHAPSSPSHRRDEFWQDYFEKGFLYIAKKYCGYTIYNRLKESIKTLIR